VCDFVDYKLYFRAIYDAAKRQDAHFTYVVFTEQLGLGNSNLMNLIVNGQRKLSRKNALVVVASLGLVLERRRYFLRLADLDNTRNMKKREDILEKIIDIRDESIADDNVRNQLRFYSHWLNGILFEYISISNTNHSAEAIAARLVPHAGADEVQKSLDLLASMGLIRLNPKSGRYEKVEDHFIMDDKIQNLGPIAFHNKMIDLAKDALMRVEEEKRDISSITLALPAKSIPILKKMVEDFQNEVLNMAENFDSLEEVYQINVQLFPLTGKSKRK
jgi:uncharacterized protein (TIGR02147 family)